MDNLSLFLKVVEAMHGTLDLDRRIYIILVCVTAGCAFGFSRAFVLLRNEEGNMLEGKMGVGPTSQEDANRIWCQMSQQNKSLEELLREYDKISSKESMPLYSLVKKLNIPLSRENDPIIKCLKEKIAIKVTRAQDNGVSEEFINNLRAEEFVCIPLIVENEAVGVLLADNLYSQRPISEESVQSLALFAHQMGLAIEEARLHLKLMENQEKLREMEKELRKLYVLASLGEMSAYLAHEIRNPLVAIGGFARSIFKRLDKPDTPEEIREKVKTMIKEVERLESLLSRTLDFSHLGEPNLRQRNVTKIIEEICRLIEDELGEKNIELHKDFQPLPDLEIDEDLFKQALFNLIQNAIESMSPRGGKLQIKTGRWEKFVKIEISDSGKGIPSHMREKIFLPFFTTKTKSSGLGLAVTKQIIERHGGYLNLESRENEGTSVFIHLPLSNKE